MCNHADCKKIFDYGGEMEILVGVSIAEDDLLYPDTCKFGDDDNCYIRLVAKVASDMYGIGFTEELFDKCFRDSNGNINCRINNGRPTFIGDLNGI